MESSQLRCGRLGNWLGVFGLLWALGPVSWPQALAQDQEPSAEEEDAPPPRIMPFPGGPPRGGPGRPGIAPPGRFEQQMGPDGAGPDGGPPPPGPDDLQEEDEEGTSSASRRRTLTPKTSSSSEEDDAAADDEDSSTSTGGTSSGTSGERQRPPIIDSQAKVTIDFVDTELTEIVKYMAEITGRNFILGDKLSGKVTIISHEQVTAAEAYEAFLSAMEVAGYTTVTVGKATKVMKSPDAAKSPLRTFYGDDIPATDNFVTQIIQFENVDVSEIATVVKELATSAARVIAYSPTNTMIITDSANNIRRVYKIVKELDVAAPKARLEIIPLTYATASEVEAIIEELYAVEGSSTEASAETARSRRTSANRRRTADREETQETSSTNVGEGKYISKIISDERTNSLIVKANEEAMTAIQDLVKRLDVDVDPSSRSQIHVVYLKHAKATDVAQVLSNLASSSSSYGSSSSRSSSSSRNAASTNSRSRTGSRSSSSGRSSSGAGGRMMGSSGDPYEMDAYGYDTMSGAAGPDDAPRPNRMGAMQAGGANVASGAVAAFESGMSVASDENTNSLVIIASPEDFRIIKQVVDKLDIPRKQVFVEAVVLEMATDETFDLGIGYHMGALGADGGYNAYSAQLNGYSLGLNSSDLLSGLAMGVFGQAIDISVSDGQGGSTTLNVPAFGIALNALQSNSAVNILSTPNILTMDNEEAEIVVGRNIPFPVSTGRDSNNNPIVSYQREDVAITMRVTPQINESGYVTLEVFQEVSEIEEDSEGLDTSSAGFITSKRSAETVVVVRDNQTVVIGGLIGNTTTEVETKIPLLGDLPLFGMLFRGSRTTSRKTNLLIFLTPHVISVPEDLEEVYRVKVAQRAEFLRRFYGKSLEEQQEEMSGLLQYSMNLVDEPSVYRTKVLSDSNVSTIQSEAQERGEVSVGIRAGALQGQNEGLDEVPDDTPLDDVEEGLGPDGGDEPPVEEEAP